MLHKCNIPKFQFYDSPIKSLQALVRLAVILTRFNSMIVRLKAPIGIITQLDGTTFQFYDSPIKSGRQEFKSKGNGKEFQFYDSPIKRLTYEFSGEFDTLFQFYDSPIKSSERTGQRL